MSHTTEHTIAPSVSDPYCTISRKSQTFHRHTSRLIDKRCEEYPTNREIQAQAHRSDACNFTMGHLSHEDLIWSTAMVSDQKLKLHAIFPKIHWDEYLQDLTGGKGSLTQWVHCGYIVGSGAICPHYTQWVLCDCFQKEPIKVATGYIVKETHGFFHKRPRNLITMYSAINPVGSLRVHAKTEPN